MKKMLNLLTLVAATVVGATAQQAAPAMPPRLLNETQAMLHVERTHRYLLLPVEEKEETAHIEVVSGAQNRVVQTLNVRLAADHVDYYVPLDLEALPSGQALLNVSFAAANRRQTGAMKDYVCWREMRLSDTFDTTNRERFRPAYHHTPAYGWMNDPNGMFYDATQQLWHLYYQYNPYGSQWENMTWGHSTSADLMHWEAQPAPLVPDGLGAIFSGSCVVDHENTAGFGRGAVVAFYTAAAQSQVQCMAYSTDGGRTFTKYEGNPVVTSSLPDFRDPHLFWHAATRRWVMVLAAGQEMHIYTSANLKDWQFESAFGKEYGCHDGVWECPDLFPLRVKGQDTEKWVLLCNINPGGPFGGSATQYFIGTFDGRRFTCESRPEVTKWMDYGKDHYATVTFDNAPAGRRVALAWMSNWQYANQVPTQQFRSANSVPRDLGLFQDGAETYLSSTPSPEVEAQRGKAVVRGSSARRLKRLFAQPRTAYEVVIDIDEGRSAQLVTFTLSNSRGERVAMTYDPQRQTFATDRTEAGEAAFSEHFKGVTTAPTHGALRRLRLLVDACSIEAFDAEGRMAMTNLVFPAEPYNALTVEGGARTSVTVYPL